MSEKEKVNAIGSYDARVSAELLLEILEKLEAILIVLEKEHSKSLLEKLRLKKT